MRTRSRQRAQAITRRGILAGMMACSTGAWAAAVEQAVRNNSTGAAPPRLDVPAGSCDSHHQIYDERFPASPHWRQGIAAGATVADYRLLQRRLGTSRSVVVQPSTYGIDNRCLVDALGPLGPGSRGVTVVDTDVGDKELRALTEAGERAIRVNSCLPRPGGRRHRRC
ncbi:amidohydrolase family protein [Rhodopseudomonas palustris]|uniref:Putative 2-pyrone-4,6-dicarbaxylate hydrolase n=1 Tax=Rhodopseudomonas palustris (strain BisB18) TaxID=316056 RepID=Q214C3_RHOPB